jgi:hypothetical protein
MTADEEGRRLLNDLNLDGFTPGDAALYERVEAMMRALVEQ